MYEVSGPSRRGWAAVLAVAALAGLVVFVGLDARREPDAEPVRAVPDARTGARGCGTGIPGRSVAAPDARLDVTSYGYSSRVPGEDPRERFVVTASLAPERGRAVELPASFTARSAAVDVYGPHGRGLIATGRGLRVRVVTGMKDRPAAPGKDGTYRFVRDGELSLRVEVPKRALCPGQKLSTLDEASTPGSNDAADYPVLRLTLTDPALPGGRLVSVSPDLSGVEGAQV
jgi:hypothetical protein